MCEPLGSILSTTKPFVCQLDALSTSDFKAFQIFKICTFNYEVHVNISKSESLLVPSILAKGYSHYTEPQSLKVLQTSLHLKMAQMKYLGGLYCTIYYVASVSL